MVASESLGQKEAGWAHLFHLRAVDSTQLQSKYSRVCNKLSNKLDTAFSNLKAAISVNNSL